MPYLAILDDINREGPITIIEPGKGLNIGRSLSNDFVVKDPRVSKRHAQIRHDNGILYLEDLQSAWGTSVNGKKIRTIVLQDGDELRFGPEYSVRFYSGNPPLNNGPFNHVNNDDQLGIEGDLNDGHDVLLGTEKSNTVIELDIELEDIDTVNIPHTGFTSKLLPALIRIDDKCQEISRYTIKVPLVSIGRSKSNQIVLDHNTVSRFHCEILETDEGYRISDLESGNGISINDVKKRQSDLVDGDLIQIGLIQFRFIQPGQRKKKNGQSLSLDSAMSQNSQSEIVDTPKIALVPKFDENRWEDFAGLELTLVKKRVVTALSLISIITMLVILYFLVI